MAAITDVKDLMKDLSVLTTIPEKDIEKLFRKLAYCIYESIVEDTLAEKDITHLNIGIGVLSVKHDDPENLKFHFEPESVFKKNIKKSVEGKENILSDTLAVSLATKFGELYKDLC